jgi:vacuolar protein sorting-associated protein IST1
MACGRIQIASNKKTALLKQSTREVAMMLAEDPPKEEKARIRAEALIRDDHLIEAYEILQLECELLHERIKLISYCKTCPHDLVSVVSTLIWASRRVDIPELALIRKQFVAKYGKMFEENAMRNYDGILNERVVSRLSVEPPPAYLVQSYLEKICDQHDVNWTPSLKLTANDMIEPMAPPTGYSILPSATGTRLGPNTVAVPATGTSVVLPNIGASDPMMIPPPAPSKFSQETLSKNGESKNNNLPPPSTGATTSSLFDEPDIFVPCPSAPPPSTINIPKPEEDDDSHDEENSGFTSKDQANGGGDDFSDSYSNLAARFNQLKK